MTTATVLVSVMFSVGMCSASSRDKKPVFACNLKAISAAERPRYNELVKRVRAAIRKPSETAEGFTFKLDSNAVTLPEAAEWITMERLCCPFLTLQLAAAGNQTDWTLALTGSEGAKSIIAAEFPAR